jgi:hypothetical protein
MKAAIFLILALLPGAAFADSGLERKSSWRLAETVNACLVNCASQNEACRRICPTTYNGPCIGACDNQAQFCKQTCQQK